MEEQLITQGLSALSSTGALVLLGVLLWLRSNDKKNGSGDHDAIVRLQEQTEAMTDNVQELRLDMKTVKQDVATLVARSKF